MLKITSGNLLEADVEALVNTVNTVGVMGKGIALQFKKAYPANYQAYVKACRAGEMRPGSVLVHDMGGLLRPRYIINFPSKRDWRSKSRLEDIRSGLDALVAEIRRLGIRSIALPPLGCGNGGLHWTDVFPLMQKAFADLPEVEALVYSPDGAPAPEKQVNRREPPAMTAGRAVVLGVMQRYLATGYEYRLSLLEVQKLVYFLVAAGEPLNSVEFIKGPYGPYADVIRHVLERMEGHFTTGYGDGKNSPETPITPKPEAVYLANKYLLEEPDTLAHLNRVMQLIEGFETPYGLEVLASTHWIATRELNEDPTPDAVVAGVRAWSTRKARVLRSEHIETAFERLSEQGWVSPHSDTVAAN
jgi:O-acetyl-ADP-ribose deacetylase (regulator of RNase III)